MTSEQIAELVSIDNSKGGTLTESIVSQILSTLYAELEQWQALVNFWLEYIKANTPISGGGGG
jgi:hypothetical protein